ncbi:MAG: R3H domain-containing nucleic acid-binding protein, partial [Chloroflexota bacterium]
GGVQSVTLGDEEAHRRGTRKSVLERKAPPTFDIVVEIQDWYRVTVYRDVTQAIDAILRGETPEAERRWLTETGEVGHEKVSVVPAVPVLDQGGKATRVYLYGVDRSRLESAAGARSIALQVVKSPADANLVLTTRRHYQQKNKGIKDAEASRIPIYVLRSTAPGQIERCLDSLYPAAKEVVGQALGEASKAIDLVERSGRSVELAPQTNYIRRLQHMLAEERNLASRSVGREPQRRVVVSRPGSV